LLQSRWLRVAVVLLIVLICGPTLLGELGLVVPLAVGLVLFLLGFQICAGLLGLGNVVLVGQLHWVERGRLGLCLRGGVGLQQAPELVIEV
jgi:hypothetical protein